MASFLLAGELYVKSNKSFSLRSWEKRYCHLRRDAIAVFPPEGDSSAKPDRLVPLADADIAVPDGSNSKHVFEVKVPLRVWMREVKGAPKASGGVATGDSVVVSLRAIDSVRLSSWLDVMATRTVAKTVLGRPTTPRSTRGGWPTPRMAPVSPVKAAPTPPMPSSVASSPRSVSSRRADGLSVVVPPTPPHLRSRRVSSPAFAAASPSPAPAIMLSPPPSAAADMAAGGKQVPASASPAPAPAPSPSPPPPAPAVHAAVSPHQRPAGSRRAPAILHEADSPSGDERSPVPPPTANPYTEDMPFLETPVPSPLATEAPSPGTLPAPWDVSPPAPAPKPAPDTMAAAPSPPAPSPPTPSPSVPSPQALPSPPPPPSAASPSPPPPEDVVIPPAAMERLASPVAHALHDLPLPPPPWGAVDAHRAFMGEERAAVSTLLRHTASKILDDTGDSSLSNRLSTLSSVCQVPSGAARVSLPPAALTFGDDTLQELEDAKSAVTASRSVGDDVKTQTVQRINRLMRANASLKTALASHAPAALPRYASSATLPLPPPARLPPPVPAALPAPDAQRPASVSSRSTASVSVPPPVAAPATHPDVPMASAPPPPNSYASIMMRGRTPRTPATTTASVVDSEDFQALMARLEDGAAPLSMMQRKPTGKGPMPEPLHLSPFAPLSGPGPATPVLPSVPLSELNGCRVRLSGGRLGVVGFVGTTAFGKGTWIGVDLDEPRGKHNGVMHGHRYFSVRRARGGGKFGVFVRPSPSVTVVAHPAYQGPVELALDVPDAEEKRVVTARAAGDKALPPPSASALELGLPSEEGGGAATTRMPSPVAPVEAPEPPPATTKPAKRRSTGGTRRRSTRSVARPGGVASGTQTSLSPKKYSRGPLSPNQALSPRSLKQVEPRAEAWLRTLGMRRYLPLFFRHAKATMTAGNIKPYKNRYLTLEYFQGLQIRDMKSLGIDASHIPLLSTAVRTLRHAVTELGRPVSTRGVTLSEDSLFLLEATADDMLVPSLQEATAARASSPSGSSEPDLLSPAAGTVSTVPAASPPSPTSLTQSPSVHSSPRPSPSPSPHPASPSPSPSPTPVQYGDEGAPLPLPSPPALPPPSPTHARVIKAASQRHTHALVSSLLALKKPQEYVTADVVAAFLGAPPPPLSPQAGDEPPSSSGFPLSMYASLAEGDPSHPAPVEGWVSSVAFAGDGDGSIMPMATLLPVFSGAELRESKEEPPRAAPSASSIRFQALADAMDGGDEAAQHPSSPFLRQGSGGGAPPIPLPGLSSIVNLHAAMVADRLAGDDAPPAAITRRSPSTADVEPVVDGAVGDWLTSLGCFHLRDLFAKCGLCHLEDVSLLTTEHLNMMHLHTHEEDVLRDAVEALKSKPFVRSGQQAGNGHRVPSPPLRQAVPRQPPPVRSPAPSPPLRQDVPRQPPPARSPLPPPLSLSPLPSPPPGLIPRQRSPLVPRSHSPQRLGDANRPASPALSAVSSSSRARDLVKSTMARSATSVSPRLAHMAEVSRQRTERLGRDAGGSRLLAPTASSKRKETTKRLQAGLQTRFDGKDLLKKGRRRR